MSKLRVVLSMVLIGVFVAACGGDKGSQPGRSRRSRDDRRQGNAAAAQNPAANKALFEQTCSKCHPVAKPENYQGPLAWKDVVAKMINEKQAKIAPEDAGKIVAYLEATHPKK